MKLVGIVGTADDLEEHSVRSVKEANAVVDFVASLTVQNHASEGEDVSWALVVSCARVPANPNWNSIAVAVSSEEACKSTRVG